MSPSESPNGSHPKSQIRLIKFINGFQSDLSDFSRLFRVFRVRAGSLAVLLGDGHGDSLDLSVVLQAILTQLTANAGLLKSSEGGGRGEGVEGVDPDGARSQGVAHIHNLAEVLGENCSSQSIGVAAKIGLADKTRVSIIKLLTC